jgi:hypothetical protein
VIKIGGSRDPSRRLRELSREVLHPVHVLATVRGDFEVECHRLFAEYRAFDEWFDPHPDVLAEIQRLQRCRLRAARPPSPARALSNHFAKNSHLPFRRRERAMLRFRQMKSLQKLASVHASFHNHFNLERHLIDRETYKTRRSAALAEWQNLLA